MARKTLAGAGLLLVLFHIWLFASQAWAGELADLALVGRWAVTAALVWLFVGLRRQGAPIFWGRKAIALWALAALLHGPAVLQRLDAPGSPTAPDAVAILVQVTVGATLLAGALLTGLTVARRRRVTTVALPIRSDHAFLGSQGPGAYLLIAPRPPPAR
jgi:hypothetical protein